MSGMAHFFMSVGGSKFHERLAHFFIDIYNQKQPLGAIASVGAFPKERQEKFADLLYQMLMLYSDSGITTIT